MPTFEITSPDGRTFRVDGPEGSTKEQALEQVKSKLGGASSKPVEPPAPSSEERGPVSEIARQVGLTARAGIQNAAAIPNMVGDALGLQSTEAVKNALTKLGLPLPETAIERIAQDVAGAMAGVGAVGKTAQMASPTGPVGRAIAKGLGDNVGPQVASAAAGGAGVGITRESGGTQAEQLAAGIGAGIVAPQAAASALNAAKRAVANPQTVQKNLDTFKAAGTAPDAAQASESNFLRGLTNVIGRFPGGQGIISKFRETEQEALANSARTGVSAEAGGKAIQKGIEGEGGFLERTKATWQGLDQAVAAKIPKGSSFAPSNTAKVLDELTTPVAGAEKTTGALVNPKIAEFKANLAADMQANNGQVPFDALRALRSKVGSMLDESLVSGIPNGELKRLYGGLSKDLETAATQAGAGREFQRQQNYYRARMERIENTLETVIGNKNPEQILKGLAPTDPDAVTKVRRVFRSLDDDQRQVVSDAIVNRLGRVSGGKQDASGEKFSSETFLTNWSKINDSAKAQLFPDATMRKKLDSIAAVSSDIRDSGRVFGNNSGTAQGMSAAGVYGSIPLAAGAALTGNVATAGATLAATGSLVAGANIGARMLTNPKIVDWLAKSAKVTTPEQMTAQVGRLAVIFNETKDEALKQDLGQYLQSVKQ